MAGRILRGETGPHRPVRRTLFAVVALTTVLVCTNLLRGCDATADDSFDLVAEATRPKPLVTGHGVPKFGDRISPRHRPGVEGGGSGASTSSTHGGAHGVTTSNNNSVIRGIVGNSNSFSDNYGGDRATIDALDKLLMHDRRTGRSSHLPNAVSNEVTEMSAVRPTATDRIGLTADSGEFEPDDEDETDGNDSSNDNAISVSDNQILLTVSPNEVDGIVSPDPSRSRSEQNASAQAHRLEMSTEFFVVPSTAAASVQRSTTIRPGGVVFAARPNANQSGSHGGNRLITGATPPTIVSTSPHYATGLRREPWVVPVLVLAALTMIMMAAFEIFVLCKAWRTSPSRRHLFLGQMLLLGLFACAGIAAIITATPTLLSCATVRFGAGVAYALVFASLLVKCVFLISLNGGVYLPAPYQGLLLLFAVLIQVAIGAQWLLTSPPAMDNVAVTARSAGGINGGAGMNGAGGGNGGTLAGGAAGRYPLLLTAQDVQMTTVPLCRTPFTEVLFSLVYVLFLIVFVAVLAIKSRGIRDNYREATYIGLAIGGSIPIWFAWILCGLAVSERHKDACLAFGLVATSATVFLVMFMPKGRQLAAMGKEGLYVEDREEQFSSLSRAGSGYSPSFFHFKPIKYGVMGAAPVTTTTTSTTHTTAHAANSNHHNHHSNNNNNNHHAASGKHQQAAAAIATLGGGLFMRPDEANLYTTLEPTLSSNPNVYFQRGGGVHPGMMY